MKYNIFPAIFLCLLFVACKKEAPKEVEETARPVRYQKVIKTGLSSSNTFSGVCQSDKETKMSFKVAGKIKKLNIEIGDRVKRGQLIATIDPEDYSITYDQSLDQVKAAKTQLQMAKTQKIANESNYQRIQKLYENNSVPLSQFEQAEAAYETSVSQYKAAQAQLSTTQKQVSAANNQVAYTRLKAPFSGVITEVNVNENELVGSGNPIAVISSTSKPEVEVGIPESFIGQIEKGQEVSIHISAIADRVFKGKISEVAYSSNEKSTYPVIIKINKPSSRIRPGMAAAVTFSKEDKMAKNSQIVVAPYKAIGKGTKGHFAFVIKANGDDYKAHKTKVEIGELTQDGFEIKKGLKEGDMVATAGLTSLLDGLSISLME